MQGSRRQEYWAADARGPRAQQASKLETRLLLSRSEGGTVARAGGYPHIFGSGFTVEQMVDLCFAALATATPERMVAGGRTIEVARVRITDAGRRALAARKS